MLVLGVLGFTIIACILSIPVFWAWRFAAQYPPRSGPPVDDELLPRAVVMLAIRGADPYLRRCLEGLLDQDYPDYDVTIIVDSSADPAWDIVCEMVAGWPERRVYICLLEHHYETCTLKLSALIQAISEMEDCYGVVATIDSDVVPHRTWLRELAEPLVDPTVGAASGVRWYMPIHRNLASVIRYLWNAGAFTQMKQFQIPWGGSLAYRADLFRTTDLLERWQHSFSEDTGSSRLLRERGLQLRMVPAATMVNREDIDLKGCFQFIRRQLLCARLHHPSWPAILLASFGVSLAVLWAAMWLAAALAAGDWGWAGCLAGMLACFGLGLQGALFRVQSWLNVRARDKGESFAYLTLWQALLAIPVTQMVYFASLISATLLRRVSWRGIIYEVAGSEAVRLLEYRPYCPPESVSGRNSSLV